LEDAGYPNGFETKIIPMSFGIDRDVMVLIQSCLGQIGIKVDLDFVPYSKYTEYRYKGWHNAILCQPVASYANFNKTLESYLAEDSPQFPSLKRPNGYQDILNESLITTEMDIPKIQKVIMKIFQEAMVIPIHDVSRAFIKQKNVHDTGHMEYSLHIIWRPDNTWLSK
jgi:ABC-type transport system substrate-binding protein